MVKKNNGKELYNGDNVTQITYSNIYSPAINVK